MNLPIRGSAMEKTRFSMFYLAGYMLASGLMLLIAPDFAFKLLWSNGDYGDIFPRVTGMLLIGWGIAIAQVIRLRLSSFYFTTLIVRSFFFVCLFSFYMLTYDPFFLTLLVVVGIGMILTATSYIRDQQQVLTSTQKGIVNFTRHK